MMSMVRFRRENKAKSGNTKEQLSGPITGESEGDDVCRKMIEATIREYCSITNPDFIIRFANSVSGLVVDEKGKLKSGASIENFIALVEKARDAFGPVAFLLAKKAISGIVTKNMEKNLSDDMR